MKESLLSRTEALSTRKQLIKKREDRAPKIVKNNGIFLISAGRNSESIRSKL